MQVISYKVLFEVRILHDYYLEDNLGKSFYELDPTAQNALLISKLRDRKYDILKDLEILLSPADSIIFKNFHLKMVKTPTGFYLGAEVKPPVVFDGKERFSMQITPPDDIQLTFGLAATSGFFSSITNVRADRDTTSPLYYFTNAGNHSGTSLSVPVSPIAGGTTYEMGDLAQIGGNIHQATERNTGDRTKWTRLQGDGFVHQADRSLPAGEPWLKEWLRAFRPARRNLLGMIRIGLQSATPGMSLVDNNGFLPLPSAPNLKHPVFEIRFLSRSTYWQYQKQGGFSDEEKSRINASAGTFLDFKNGKYISKKPQRFAISKLRMSTDSFRLPNALPGIFKSENGRLISEVNFNINTPVP